VAAAKISGRFNENTNTLSPYESAGNSQIIIVVIGVGLKNHIIDFSYTSPEKQSITVTAYHFDTFRV